MQCLFSPARSPTFQSRNLACRSHADSAKSSSSETDCNDNLPCHKPPAPSGSKHAVNGFFPPQGIYDSPPSRSALTLADSSLYNLPRSYSQDVLPKAASPSGTEGEGEQHVFSTPSATSLDAQMRHISISYDIPPTPGGTYQIPRTFPEGTLSQTSKLETIPDIPPPRPPKPHQAADRSPVESCSMGRTASDTDSSYCIPAAGAPPSRSNTISTGDLNVFRKGRYALSYPDQFCLQLCGLNDVRGIPSLFPVFKIYNKEERRLSCFIFLPGLGLNA